MLSLREVSVVKDGGSRQMQFTDETGGVHEFYLHKETREDESKPSKRIYSGLFKGNMTGPNPSKAEQATPEEVQMVCEALENWNRLHDTAQYRELKTRWDALSRRLEKSMSGDNNQEINAIMKGLSEIEGSENWRDHVEEALWVKNAIFETP
ncbi:MAG: hypothetical protein RL693_1725 [Verrucomicrobiota bacterium]|jgi:hypothetical protein